MDLHAVLTSRRTRIGFLVGALLLYAALMGYGAFAGSSVAFALARSAIQCGEYRAARRLLARSITKYPVLPRAYLFLALVSLGTYSFEPARRAKRLAVRVGRAD